MSTSGTTSSCGSWLNREASKTLKHYTKWQMHPWRSAKLRHNWGMSLSSMQLQPTLRHPKLQTAPEASMYMQLMLT